MKGNNMSSTTINNYKYTPNNTFEMLKIPSGSTLSATFKGKEFKATVVDDVNKIMDLSTGEITTPSGMANKYLGGSNNGWEYFRYNGRKLSEIRGEMDSGYYYKTPPEQKVGIANISNEKADNPQKINKEQKISVVFKKNKPTILQEQVCELTIIPALEQLVEEGNEKLYEIISKKVTDLSGIIPSEDMVFKFMLNLLVEHAMRIASKQPLRHKSTILNSEVITYAPGENRYQ